MNNHGSIDTTDNGATALESRLLEVQRVCGKVPLNLIIQVRGMGHDRVTYIARVMCGDHELYQQVSSDFYNLMDLVERDAPKIQTKFKEAKLEQAIRDKLINIFSDTVDDLVRTRFRAEE